MWRNFNICASLVKVSNSKAITENSMDIPQNPEDRIYHMTDPAIPLLGTHPKEFKTRSGRGICTPVLSFTTVRRWKKPKCLPKDY